MLKYDFLVKPDYENIPPFLISFFDFLALRSLMPVGHSGMAYKKYELIKIRNVIEQLGMKGILKETVSFMIQSCNEELTLELKDGTEADRDLAIELFTNSYKKLGLTQREAILQIDQCSGYELEYLSGKEKLELQNFEETIENLGIPEKFSDLLIEE